ncbi:hypothetical protein LTR37_020970 [Vermiconidia calcicola]|uniref:Uncharacterized protein n=1 Tax=Vermiconidia calcicola TaxID=1690605 RepID=A0ACC3MBM8_9PEZI|nr:hypothetical protein LTR37_020970 [Vermiconidia calcicola]
MAEELILLPDPHDTLFRMTRKVLKQTWELDNALEELCNALGQYSILPADGRKGCEADLLAETTVETKAHRADKICFFALSSFDPSSLTLMCEGTAGDFLPSRVPPPPPPARVAYCRRKLEQRTLLQLRE